MGRQLLCSAICADLLMREGARILRDILDDIDVIISLDNTTQIQIHCSPETFDRLCIWRSVCENCEMSAEGDCADYEEDNGS